MRSLKYLVVLAALISAQVFTGLASAQSVPAPGDASAGPQRVAMSTLAQQFRQMTNVAAESGPLWTAEGSRAGGRLKVYNRLDRSTVYDSSSDCDVSTVCSTNWAGLEAYNDTFTGVEADWTVPTVSPTSLSPEDSSTWIGIDGDPYYDGTEDPPLIQTGTDSPSYFPGEPSLYYEAWVELYPGAEQPLFSVQPGDSMAAEIFEPSPDMWDLSIEDVTEDVAYTLSNVPFVTPGATAEWIEEATTICPSPSSCYTSQLQDFGTATFTNWGFDDSGADSAYGQTDDMVDQDGNIIASASWDDTAVNIDYVPQTVGLSGWGTAVPPGDLYVGDGMNGPPISPVSCAPGTSHCVAVLASTSVTTGLGKIGQAVAATDDMENWTAHYSLPAQFSQVLSVSCPTASHCVAVGVSDADTSVIAVSTDGGSTWSLANLTAFASAPGWAQAITCPSALVCYVAGGDQVPYVPMMAESVDGGTDWTLLDHELPGGSYNLDAISCPSALSCVAAGQTAAEGPATVIFTTDGGSNWVASSSSVLDGLAGIFALSCPSGTTVCFAGAAAIGAGGPAVATSSDGGATWSTLSLPYGTGWISSITCPDAQTCWAAGGGTTLSLAETSNGWSTSTPLLGSTTNQDSSVSCASTEFCIATTDNELLATTDNAGLVPDVPAPPPTTDSSTTTSTTTTTLTSPTSTSPTTTPTPGDGTTPPAPSGPSPASPGTTTVTSSTVATATVASTTTTTVVTKGSHGGHAATTPTSPRQTVSQIFLVSSNAKVSNGDVPLKLKCSAAACSGTVELTPKPKGSMDKQTKVVVLAKSSYSVRKGTTFTLRLVVTPDGAKMFKEYPSHSWLCTASVRGGKTRSAMIKLT